MFMIIHEVYDPYDYTRFFKLHLKMAYTIFQTPLQASVQVYKYNRCFNIKAASDPF